MSITAPEIQSPADESTGVDHLAPITILIDKHLPETATAFGTTIVIPATQVEDPLASAGWTDPDRLITTTGNQNNMASAVEVWRLNRVNWRGSGAWPGDLTRVVTSVVPQCYALRDTDSNSTWVMWNGIYNNEHRSNVIFASPGVVWTGAGAATLIPNGGERPVSIDQLFQDLLGGPRYTLQQLKDLLEEADPEDPADTTLANFRVAVHPYSYYGEVGAGYHAAGLRLRITHLDDDPVYQGGFEVQVSTDNTFATVDWSAIVYGRYNATAIPAGALAGGTLYYVRARRWSTEIPTPTDSGWGTTTEFTTIADGTARLVHAEGHGALVYEMHDGHWLIGSQCRLETRSVTDPSDGSTVNPTHVYHSMLDRRTMPIGNWWIDPYWEEHGVPVLWTECYSIAEVEVTLRGWFLDDQGIEGDRGRLYIRPPFAPGGYGSFGLMLSLVHPVSDTPGIRCGPGMRYTADPWVKGHPSVDYAIEDITEGVPNTPQGNLVLVNPEWPGDTQRRRVFDLVLGEPDTFGNIGAGKVVAYRRRIRAALCGTPAFPVPYAERVHVFDGLYSWDENALVSVDSATFRCGGREQQEATPVYRIDGLGSETTPAAEDQGRAPEDAVGAAVGLTPIYIGGRSWRVAKHALTISEYRINGSAVTLDSFDPLTHIAVEPVSAPSPVGFSRRYDVGSTGTLSAGATYSANLAIEVLTEHVVPPYPVADINQASFDRINTYHDSFSASWPGLVLCALPMLETNTLGLKAIRTLENSGGFHVCRTPSGQVIATFMKPDGPDAWTIYLRESDLLGEIVATIDHARLSQYVSVSFSGKTTAVPGSGGGDAYTAKWVSPGLWPADMLKRLDQVEIETAHTTTNGADWVWSHLWPFEAMRTYEVDVKRSAALAFPGATVVLTIPRGKSEDGILDLELCKVLSLKPELPACDKWRLKALWIKRIGTAERAFAA